jgi:hypothetical protein
VRRRLSLLLALTAWLLATGSHWDIVQTYAWGRMIVHYSRSVPLVEAVRLTFTPGNECRVCLVVQTAQEQAPEPAVPGAAAADKRLMALPPMSPAVLPLPDKVPWQVARGGSVPARRECPPVPPPRRATA